MKVMIRKNSDGQYFAYVPKKDLEEPIVLQQHPHLWGGLVTLANGWVLELPELPETPRLPITVDARKVGE